jgi:hypothetical protein
MRALYLTVVCASVAFAQAKIVELEKAQELMGNKKYEAALKSLDAAAKRTGIDRDSWLTILELKGLAEAQLGKAALSESTFKQLLSLDLKRNLVGKYSGKPAAPIAAAQAFVLNSGPLEAIALEPGAENGVLKQISVGVKSDPIGMAKVVKFHVKSPSGAWKQTESPLSNGSATCDVNGTNIEYWIEVLGERSTQLVFLGTAVKPLKAMAPAPVAIAKPVAKEVPAEEPKVAMTPVERKVEPMAVRTEAPTEGSILRPVSYGLMGAGVVAVGVGVYFGVTSSGLRDGIKKDLAAGGANQEVLYKRDQQAIADATIANVLFVAGGAVAVTGGILWFISGDKAPATVAVVPSLQGVSVSGSF